MTKKNSESDPASAEPDAPATGAGRVEADARAVFPIVGIGMSAGGLEALELFLQHIPKNSGLALVVVQHLDPNSKSMLVELLQRCTDMPVVEVQDRTPVERDHVYVIPPNQDLSLLHGVLHLIEPNAPRGLRLAVDFFFCSLAVDLCERSVGVILSGMGADGTAGLRAIKEKGGATFVQEPTSAKFAGMPASAVESANPDVVAPVQELPQKILEYLSHRPALTSHGSHPTSLDPGSLEKIFILLRARSGHDFAVYKTRTVYRRVERRMALHRLTRLADYARFLRENPQEIDLLFSELLIGVTSFFRDPEVWDEVRDDIMPRLFAKHPQGGQLRAWVAACSTGEEAYTLAIVFKEALAALTPARNISLQIFATDLDSQAIDKARAAVFPASITVDVAPERLERFFVAEGRGFRVTKEVRDLVIFAPHNAIMDPPFPRLDFLSCRNLLIYLEAEAQKKLLRLFHYSLNPGGFLLLGSAETIGGATDLFALEEGPARAYQRLVPVTPLGRLELPALPLSKPRGADKTAAIALPAEPSVEPSNLQTLADHLLLRRYAPAAVLVTTAGDVVYISGKTGRYLEPAVGKANWNLFAMAREGLSDALLEGFRSALVQHTLLVLPEVQVTGDHEVLRVKVSIEPLLDPEGLRGFVMVTLEEVVKSALPPAAEARKEGDESAPPGAATATELQTARDELAQVRQALVVKSQAMEAARQEAHAAHEEYLSMNEELQSTNEELTASKEEMQSMNEELQTLNQELQAKLDELSRTSSDMKNLLNATDIATLFLDDALRVRHFTPQISKLIKLLPTDAGRPISDLSSDLDYPDLVADAKTVLQTLRFCERTVSTRDNRWFTVRIMPYATHDNRIEGLVITFADVSTAKRLESELRANESKLRELLETEQDKGKSP